MLKYGFLSKFVVMKGMLFINVSKNLKVNRFQSPSFTIGRWVHLRCSLAPYLFLVVARILNYMIKK